MLKYIHIWETTNLAIAPFLVQFTLQNPSIKVFCLFWNLFLWRFYIFSKGQGYKKPNKVA